MRWGWCSRRGAVTPEGHQILNILIGFAAARRLGGGGILVGRPAREEADLVVHALQQVFVDQAGDADHLPHDSQPRLRNHQFFSRMVPVFFLIDLLRETQI